MINGVTGTLGDAAFNGWASVDLVEQAAGEARPRFPEARGRDDAQHAAVSSAQPWSNATIDVNGLNYIDAQVRISAAELNIGDARFAPAAIDATLASGVLKAQVSNLGAYDGNANGDLTVDASTANPDLRDAGRPHRRARACRCCSGLADFDKLDGKMQAKISVRSSGTSQRAIMSNMAGTAFVVFQDGAIKGLNVAQMIRSLTASTLSGWQESEEKATDLSQLSASFKIDKGQAQTTDLNLVGPLVKMTGAGTIDLGTKQIGFRVEPKLVMTTEGQGRATDPVGLGIPVMIDGPVGRAADLSGDAGHPRQSRRRLCQAEGDGQGPVRPERRRPWGCDRQPARRTAGRGRRTARRRRRTGRGGQQPGSPLGGQLGETLGNLLQQGLGGLGQSQGQGRRAGRAASAASRAAASPAEAPTETAPTEAAPAEPAAPAPPSETTAQQDSQPMNDVLRQLVQPVSSQPRVPHPDPQGEGRSLTAVFRP